MGNLCGVARWRSTCGQHVSPLCVDLDIDEHRLVVLVALAGVQHADNAGGRLAIAVHIVLICVQLLPHANICNAQNAFATSSQCCLFVN